MSIKNQSLCFVLAVLASCNEPSEIGADFFKEGGIGLIITDTLSLKVSTVLSDSTIVGNSSRLLVGYHDDIDLGKIFASAFFQMEPRSTGGEGESNIYYLDEGSSEYLETTLILWYDSYSYYDTTSYQTLYVHALRQEIEPEEDGNFYNTSDSEFFRIPIGQISFRPKPGTRESIEIPLSDSLGQIIYAKAIDGVNDLSVPEPFVNDILKGLSLRPDTLASAAVLGFDTKAELRVHYLDRSVVPSEEKYLRFFVSSIRYNQILAERSSTPLHALNTRKESLDSELTAGRAYAQGGDALFIRVEIPYLKSILIDNTDLILTQAVLSFRPIKGSNKNNTPLPSHLKMYAVNDRNEIYADLLSPPYGAGTVPLIEDVDLNRDTYYKVDITNFIESQLDIEEFNENAILLSLVDEDIRSSVNRLYVGDQNNEFEMELALYFAVVR